MQTSAPVVVQLERPARKPDPDMVRYLEQALERARAGDLKYLIMVEEDHENEFRLTTVGTTDRIYTAGYLQYAAHTIYSRLGVESK